MSPYSLIRQLNAKKTVMKPLYPFLLLGILLAISSCKKEEVTIDAREVLSEWRLTGVHTTSSFTDFNGLFRTREIFESYSYDDQGRLEWVDKEQKSDGEVISLSRKSHHYQGDLLERTESVNQLSASADPPTIVTAYAYDNNQRLTSSERYRSQNGTISYYPYDEYHYGQDRQVQRVDRFKTSSKEEMEGVIYYKWENGNLTSESHHVGEDEQLYVRYFREYDNRINPYALKATNPLGVLTSLSNVVLERAQDGGWYHGPGIIDSEWEYNENGLPVQVTRSYFQNVVINAVTVFEYERVP